MNLAVGNTFNKTLYIYFYMQRNIINPKSYEMPYKKTYNYAKAGVSIDNTNKTTILTNIKYKTANIETDTGVIFQESTGLDFLEFENMEVNTDPAYDDSLFTARTLISRSKTFYYRSYIKVPDVLAQVGGFVSLAHVAIQILYMLYIDNEFVVYLMNTYFKLEIEEDNVSTDNKDKENILQINNKSNNLENSKINKDLKELDNSNVELKNLANFGNKEQISNNTYNVNANMNISQNKSTHLKSLKINQKHNNQDKVWNKDIEKIIEFQSKIRTKIEVTTCERCALYCGSDKTNDLKTKLRFELIKAAGREYLKKTEIIDLWRNIDQLKILIKLVLNESQSFMLKNKGLKNIVNKDSKRVINIGSKDSLLDIKEEKYKEDKIKLLNYLKLKLAGNQLPNVDKVLFGYLDEQVKAEIIEAINK